jgi:hypothetical protein
MLTHARLAGGCGVQKICYGLFLLLLLLACVMGFSVSGFGQAETASLSGTVMDPTGAVVIDAEVQVTNVDTNISTVARSNHAGVYVVAGLRPGRYRVIVTKQGFKQIALTDLTLNTQDSVSRNFSLPIGAASETVTVSANAEHLATDNPAVGVLVTRTFIENMPLNGRSFQDLIALAPGTVTANDGTGLFSINGQYADSNYYSVDGVAANVNPRPGFFPGQATAGTIPSQTVLGTTQALASVDALQEFKIQTSGYTAEYGRQPGGQIELTTRSGTNDIHGTLFDYFRNTVLDANDWFFNQQGIPKQAEHQNDFGGTIGGPLRIPKLYDGKNKTFYFFSYEGLRLYQPAFSGILDVPTVAFRQFAAPGWQPFFNAIPLPNVAGHLTNGDQCAASVGQTFSCTGEFAAGYSDPSSLDSISFRLDQVVGPKLQLFVHYADTPSRAALRDGGSMFDTNEINTRSWTLGSTAKFTPNLLDELRFNYTVGDGNQRRTPVAFGGAVPYPKSLIIPPQYAPGDTPATGGVFVTLSQADHLNNISIPGYFRVFQQQRQYNLVDSLSWTHADHTLKVGADYRRLLPLYNPQQYFSDLFLSSLAGAQQGFADSVLISAFQHAHPVFNNLSLYAEDHWKINSHLTLDYGLRWEFNPAPGASDGLYPLALTTGNLATAKLAAPGTPQYHTVYHDFAPRLGFAYQVNASQSHALVVRGGFGIFYNTGQATAAGGYGGYPFSAFPKMLTNVSLPASAQVLAPPSLNIPLVPPYGFLAGVSDPSLKLPYTEGWNLSLDGALSAKNTLTISYVGNAGKKLLFLGNYDLSQINPAFTQLSLTSNAGSSAYHSLQVQDQGYVAPGMQLVASYTWAHAIDTASTDLSGDVPLRGNSDNDARQVLNAALNYEIPGAESNGFITALTHGWSWDSRFTAQTGYPIDLVAGIFTLPDGTQVTTRPDVVPGVPIYLRNAPGTLGGWALNPAAFTGLVGDGRTPPGTIPVDANGVPLRRGTLPRNFVRGPGFWNLNMAVQRNFPLYERLHLIFRAEAFNIFNHPNAGNIDGNLYDSTFGTSNPRSGRVATIGVPNTLYGTGAARSLQLMLKLQF